jgi:hypothetical protein
VSSPAESQPSPLTEVLTLVIESVSLSESPASDCATEQPVEQPADLATDQPAINSQDDIWACWKLHLNDDSLHKYSLERLELYNVEIRYNAETVTLLNYIICLYIIHLQASILSQIMLESLTLYSTRPPISR